MRGPTIRRARRRVCRAIAVVLALLAGAALGDPDPWPSRSETLPNAARAAAERSATELRDDPDRRLAAARADGGGPRDAAPVDVQGDASWTVDWTGRHVARASATATVPLLDPAAERDASEHAATRRRARLEAAVAVEEAATAAVRASILLWHARERLALIEAARAVPPPRDAEQRAAYGQLLASEHGLRLDAARSQAELARIVGGDVRHPMGTFAWDRFVVSEAPASCPEGDVDLVLARQHARATRQAARHEAAREVRPTVSLSLSANLSVPDLAVPSASYGARIALDVGAPPSWPVAGRVRSEADAHGASLAVRVGTDASRSRPLWDLEVEVAEAAVRDARDRAEQRLWIERQELDWLVERLAELRPVQAPPSAYADVQTAWERISLIAHAADLRSRGEMACAIARGPAAPSAR